MASSKPEKTADLQALIDAWSTLLEAIKAGIRAMVAAADSDRNS